MNKITWVCWWNISKLHSLPHSFLAIASSRGCLVSMVFIGGGVRLFNSSIAFLIFSVPIDSTIVWKISST